MAQARAGIHDGAVGHPYVLIDEGARDLAIVANNAGRAAHSGLPKLVATR